MIRYLLVFAIIPFFICSAKPVSAQPNQVEIIDESQGLSDNRIHSFFKDRQGYIWIGTANGLNRYDGRSFRIYSPANKMDYLSSEFINSITEDSKGNLWIATRGGLNILDARRDSVTIYKPGSNSASQDATVIPSAWIWDVDIAGDGSVWLAPDARDLASFDPVTKTFSYYPWMKFAREQVPQRSNPYFSIRKIIPKSDTEWWLGTNVGLYSFNRATEQFTYYGGENGGDVWLLEYDASAGRVYFAQEAGNLYSFSVPENKIRVWTKNQLNVLAATGFADASLAGGFLIPMKQTILRFSEGEEDPDVIPLNNVFEDADQFNNATQIFTDDQHIRWIGTDNGILKLDPKLNLFHFVRAHPDRSEWRINSVFYDRVSGNYFMASPFTHSLIIVNSKTNRREELSQIGGVPLLDCAAINECDETWLWILCRGNVFRYHRQTGGFSRFPIPESARHFLFVEMIQDAENNLWFATTDGGLLVYLDQEKRWWKPSAADHFYDREVTALCSDPQRAAVWIGTYDFGLFRYDLVKDTFAYYDSQPRDEHQLHSSLIFDLAKDRNGNIWVATNSGGLSRFTYGNETKPFWNYNLTSGLPENTILAVQCDEKNRLWLLTYKSLTCMSDTGKVIRKYPFDPGFGNSDFGVLTSMTPDGEILIPVKNGFIQFHPDRLEPEPYSFPVVIRNILVNGNEIDWDGEREFAFPYHQNNIEISFSALNYSRPAEISFEYKLEGADADWNDAGGLTSLKFPNLNHGEYKLLLRARDGEGFVSSNMASFSFCILPPIWQTPWFIALIVVFTGGLLYALYRFRLNKIIELQQVRNKIAADLHDDIGSTLSSIRMYSEMVKAQIPDSSVANQLLDKISSNARESVESMSDIVWMINPKNDRFVNLLNRMESYATEMCSGKNIELDFQKTPEADGLHIPMEARKNIYLIFKEAVNNAVKYSGANQLKIVVEQTDHRMKMEVTDNGNGFDVSKIRKGNGLENMIQRARSIRGDVKIDSAFNAGTRITFSSAIP